MTSSRKSTPLLFAAAILGLGAAGCTAGAGEIASGDQPVRCDIETRKANGAIVLQGVVHASSPIEGTYRFKVSGGGSAGSTNISQGGGFSAGPGNAAELGGIMLGNRGAVYDVRLDIDANGHSYQCSKKVSGAI